MNEETLPVLYILMRNDMDSMNAGKGMAQASHASNAFVNRIVDDQANINDETIALNNVETLYNEWADETSQGFGTVLVLAVNEASMNTAVEVAESLGFMSGVVHDPTYPIRDGEVCHFIPIDTCAYVFGDKNDPKLKWVLDNFPLHP